MLAISEAISSTKLKSALIPFITAGYPTLEITAEVVDLLDKQGVQAIELGIPYSDALADGIVIQESSRVALEQEAYVEQVLLLVRTLSPQTNAPIIIFTYLNPVLSKGIDSFIKEMAQSGAKGLVVPDLPLEEADFFITLCNYYKIELILFISPSSSLDRIQRTILKAPGCIYLVSSYGVTGARDHVETNIRSLVNKIKVTSNKRVMLGFGISNELQVADLMTSDLNIDAIVMGTAFINCIKGDHGDRRYNELISFCGKLKNAMRQD